jgi:UDP-perosamine 4-acetyltransferase
MKMQREKLIIIGAGGHTRVVIDIAELLGYEIKGIIDINYQNQNEKILTYPVIGNINILGKYDPREVNIFISIGDSKVRYNYYNKVKEIGFNIPTLIHPTAIISKHVIIGEGSLINAGVIINSKVKIGCNTIINTGSIIDHETIINDNVHVAPGCKIAGRVYIDDFSFIGIGTCIVDKIKIGKSVIVGAGTVVINDIDSGDIVAGIPGKSIK